MKLKKYFEKVYNAPIYCALNIDREKARKLFSEQLSPDLVDKDWGDAHSFAFTEDNNTVYGIWIESMDDIHYLAHEVFHLVGFILNDRGIKYDAENDEPYAYLIQHLMLEFSKMNKKR